MMKYLLLIYSNEQEDSKMSDAERQTIFADYGALTESITRSGHYIGGDPLTPSNTATTVRVRKGKAQTTHGPFAETREQLGGYYKIEAKDLDEAVAIAARIPGAKNGSIEVRPVMPIPGRP
jgi:hypothetical protein